MRTLKQSNRKVKTQTGKLPNSFGFPGGNVTGGGVIRQLTKAELKQQEINLKNYLK